MKLIRDLASVPNKLKGASIALGNFDGLHRGHIAILEETLKTAASLNVPAAVMTFEPHPREFFNPEAAKLRLMRMREKITLLNKMGFAALFMPRFNAKLAATSAEDFVSELLVGQLKVKHITTGEDFGFGAKRSGNSAFLRSIGEKCGFSYHAMKHVEENGVAISSSLIRQTLSEGNLAAASLLLGRAYSISGHVVHGDKRGRQLGFPTANICLKRMFLPRAGVYKVMVKGKSIGTQHGVANIGVRPTVNGIEPRAEIHLFSNVDDIYGEYLQVEPQAFLRDEKKFERIDELKSQIALDVEKAKQ